MTETNVAAPQDALEDGGKRKKLLVAGGVGGAVLLAGAGYLLLSGGGGSEAAPPPIVHHTKKPVAAKPVRATAGKPEASAVKNLPVASSVKIGRDPFAALYLAPTTIVPGSVNANGSTNTAGSTTTSTGTSTATTGTAATTDAPYSLSLTRVVGDTGGAKLFTFTFDKTSKTVLPAQRFGKYGELVVLTYVKNSKGVPTGAVVQVGDDNPIEISIGEKVTVK